MLKKYGFTVEYDEIVNVFQSFYEKLADSEAPLITKEYLERLSKNYNLAIFTEEPSLKHFIRLINTGSQNIFYPIITMEEVGVDRQKPDCLGLGNDKRKNNH